MKVLFTIIFIFFAAIPTFMAQSVPKSDHNSLAQKTTNKFKAYLTVSSKGKALGNSELQQINIEKKIKEVVSSEEFRLYPMKI